MGSVALVTGGSRGIGAAIVRRFKSEGWSVAACSRRVVERTEADLFEACDVSNAESVRRFVKKTVERFGKIDALVNNAGIGGPNSLAPGSSDELWHQIINVNVNGVYYFCKESLPYIPDGTGRIINIGSVLSLQGVRGASAYVASKHAVLGLSRALAHEVASRKITVNTICPGWTRTEMAEERWADLEMTAEDAAKELPMRRVVEPDEIAEAVFALTRPGLKNMTGQYLTIDGGATP